MKKKYIAVLLCAVLFCGLMGCASTEAPQNSANGSASLLQEATNWFESQTSKYEILSAEAKAASFMGAELQLENTNCRSKNMERYCPIIFSHPAE